MEPERNIGTLYFWSEQWMSEKLQFTRVTLDLRHTSLPSLVTRVSSLGSNSSPRWWIKKHTGTGSPNSDTDCEKWHSYYSRWREERVWTTSSKLFYYLVFSWNVWHLVISVHFVIGTSVWRSVSRRRSTKKCPLKFVTSFSALEIGPQHSTHPIKFLFDNKYYFKNLSKEIFIKIVVILEFRRVFSDKVNSRMTYTWHNLYPLLFLHIQSEVGVPRCLFPLSNSSLNSILHVSW